MGKIDERVRKPLGSKCPKANEPCSHRVDDLCHEQGIGIECWIAACGVKDAEIVRLQKRETAAAKVLRAARARLYVGSPYFPNMDIRGRIQTWLDGEAE